MGFSSSGYIPTVKLANQNATKFKPDKALLKLAKNAIWKYNRKHSPSSSSITTKSKKHDVILFSLAVHIYLYIFYLLM